MMDAYCSSAGTLVPLTKVRPKPGWQPALYLQEEKIKRFIDLMQKENEFAPIQVQEMGDGFYEVLDGYHRFMAS
jgi:ParB-like chromosome segregation protein Spo0J